MDLRPPNINAPTPEGQLKQIKEYLFMLTQELNYKFSIIDKEQKDGENK